MRWKCVCAYDGAAFQGWQSQPNALAVQDKIERALLEMLGRPVRIHGSGRTDAGVHALGQVFHFDADWAHGPKALVAALYTRLPDTLLIKSAKRVPAGFHARFSATTKRYHYRIRLGVAEPFETDYCLSMRGPLDLERMRAGADHLLGRHDFAPFGVSNGDLIEDKVKELSLARISQRGPRIRITMEAGGFLYHMARSIVGALIKVGLGRLDPEVIGQVMASGQRIPLIETAPAKGLFLERVFYQVR